VSNRPTQNLIRSGARAGVSPQRVYRRLAPLGAHTVTSPAGHPFTYVADRSDMMARGVVWGNLKVWEATSLRAFSELSRTSERFLDVGAYSGINSLIACADGPGEAIAFEPNPAFVRSWSATSVPTDGRAASRSSQRARRTLQEPRG
jgi:hypothetical protein